MEKMFLPAVTMEKYTNIKNYLLNNINVINEYGKISISILGNYVYMEGPSERICSIEVNYD